MPWTSSGSLDDESPLRDDTDFELAGGMMTVWAKNRWMFRSILMTWLLSMALRVAPPRERELLAEFLRDFHRRTLTIAEGL